MSWQDSMSALNNALLERFPDKVIFDGVEIPCIAPPLDIFKTMTTGPFDAKVTFTFQILESDRATAGIKIRDERPIEFDSPYATQFGKDRLQFQVNNFEPDKNDSMVRLVCTFKQ